MPVSHLTELGQHPELARQVLSRRAELYGQAAPLIMSLESSLLRGDWSKSRPELDGLRLLLRSGLAYLDASSYAELVELEASAGLCQGELPSQLPQDLTPLRDHLRLLHVRLSRLLCSGSLVPLEDVVGLELRLRRRLDASEKALEDRAREREQERQAWEQEACAREFIEAGQHRKAVKCLLVSVRLQPERAVFRNDLGYVYGVLGLLEKSVIEYREAVRFNVEQVSQRTEEWMTSYFNLGMALKKLANQENEVGSDEKSLAFYREAQLAFDKFIAEAPENSRVEFTGKALAAIAEEIQILETALEKKKSARASA